jgi:hypothetical protein
MLAQECFGRIGDTSHLLNAPLFIFFIFDIEELKQETYFPGSDCF